MYCINCGNKLNEGAKFCPFCGKQVGYSKKNINVTSAKVVDSKVNVLFVISSFFVPILGIIMFVRDKDSNPKNANACAIAGISGFVFNIIVSVIMVIVRVITELN